MTPEQRLLDRIGRRLAAGVVLTGDAVGPEWRRDGVQVDGALPRLVLRPGLAAEVAEILAAASVLGQPIVVQGGRTGLSGGARPQPGEVVLSLDRMRYLSPVDALAATIDAEAGVTVEAVQRAAREQGFLLAADWGARGTATIGGGIATNAGGIRVLRHGMFADQVAGIEAVLADGTILDSMRGLPKDNAGYDLRRLFIGTEGTLGVVTRARLRLRPAAQTEAAALLALPSVGAALALLGLLRGRIGDLLSAYEILFPDVYLGTVDHLGVAPPLPPGAGLYVLLDIQGASPAHDIARFHAALAEAMDTGIVSDAVLSASGREFAQLWALREGVSGFVFAQSGIVGHDIGLPLGRMEAFLSAAADAVAAIDPGARRLVFGHLGDGNLHYIVQTTQPEAISDAVFAQVALAGGTIAAEHGIGLDKTRWMALVRSPAERGVMARLKAALDPAGILNPGRVLAAPDRA
jgi:FAD/FMN-containing dehydrogenase